MNSLNLEQLTKGQPFCAGVILLQDGYITTTLNTDGLPPHLPAGSALRVGAVGGGQEPDELIWECARREAREEVSGEVELQNSPVTYYQDLDTGLISQISCSDAIAPFLFQRKTNSNPTQPYRSGLPTGPYLYFCLYLATPLNPNLQPGDDVQGLLGIPLQKWSILEHEPTLQAALEQGAKLIENVPLERDSLLWLSDEESLRVVVSLLTTQNPV